MYFNVKPCLSTGMIQVAPKRIARYISLLSIGIPLCNACGGDDAALSGNDRATVEAEAVEIMAVLSAAAADLDFTSLFTREHVIQGRMGVLTISLLNWVFAEYSPDGKLIMDGKLSLGLGQPTPMEGELQISGSNSGTALVNMTIEVGAPADTTNADTSSSIKFGGTIDFKGLEFDVVQLIEASLNSTAVRGNE